MRVTLGFLSASITLLATAGVCLADDNSPFAQGDPPALISIEARVAHGFAVGGGMDASYWRASPVTFMATASVAVREEPRTSAYAGLVVETMGRMTTGPTAGLRTQLASGARASVGWVHLALPTSIFGPAASVGVCGSGAKALCLDLEAVVFIGGKDLAQDKVAAQLQAALGIRFDAM